MRCLVVYGFGIHLKKLNVRYHRRHFFVVSIVHILGVLTTAGWDVLDAGHGDLPGDAGDKESSCQHDEVQ